MDFDNYSIFVNYFLKRKSTKYDIFFFYSSFTDIHGPYLLNLNRWLPKEHIEMFDSGIISNSCTYKDKLVGLVNISLLI